MTTEQRLLQLIDADVELRQMEIFGHTINYAIAGAGEPLLLIHGANFGWGVWYPNITTLAKYFKVYAIDLPGAGRSSRIDYSTMDPEKDLLHTVEKFVENLGLEHVNITGFSMGGWLAMRLALSKPALVNKIVIANGVGFADYISGPDLVIGNFLFARLIARLFINPKKYESVHRFLRGVFYNKDIRLPKAFVDYFYETMQTSHNLLFISRLTALHNVLGLEHQLPQLQNDTLILWGQNDDIIPLAKNQKNFHLIPRAEVILIENVGHIPSLEQPEVFNKNVVAFLKK